MSSLLIQEPLSRHAREALFPIDAIERMVYAFYSQVREDTRLGPIFGGHIEDWTAHLDRMVSFWRSVLRAEPTFRPGPRGNPFILHQQLEGLTQQHFARWLTLFGAVTDEVFTPEGAQRARAAAHRIAEALSRGRPDRI